MKIVMLENLRMKWEAKYKELQILFCLNAGKTEWKKGTRKKNKKKNKFIVALFFSMFGCQEHETFASDK